MLFVYSHDANVQSELLDLLARRDDVIRDLLKKRLPVLTELSILVADLQNSTMICMQLPPEEYFELINQMWATLEPVFRRYYGTYGKHVGDGMVYYFFPQPDCNYLFNAVQCAYELRAEMRKLSQSWELRKNWGVQLKLKIALHEGMEWFGTFHIESKVEFTVLGDTINQVARLSDFAQGGTVWASKSLISKLPPQERRRVRYGIRRRDADNVETLIESTFAPVSSILDPARHGDKMRDIALLTVTEIIEVKPEQETQQ
jgi:class 3 adenylate cyclase